VPRILLATCLVLAGAVEALAADKESKPVTVPFELLKSGHMTAMIKVNGKGPYRVIFDTGAPITILNNKVASESGLLKNVAKPLFTVFGTMGQVKVGTIEAGDLRARDVDAIIMDHPTVATIAKAFGPIEGIIGFPFFARYKMTLDYQAREMTFVPNGYDPPDTVQAMVNALTVMTGDQQPAAKVLAPAAQWGLIVARESGDEPGVTIKTVLPGSAAATAGLQSGDRLLIIDGRWTDTVIDCYQAAGRVKPGTAATVVVKRGKKEIELSVKPLAGL